MKRCAVSRLEASLNAAPAGSPLIGRTMMVRGHECRITKVLPMGTIECESLVAPVAFRVSGLDLRSP